MPATIDREIEAFESRRAELEARHLGKWVVFHNTEFIGAYESFELAAEEAVARFGRGPYLIRQVGAPPMVLSSAVMYHPMRP
jgi:hypothetical protein